MAGRPRRELKGLRENLPAERKLLASGPTSAWDGPLDLAALLCSLFVGIKAIKEPEVNCRGQGAIAGSLRASSKQSQVPGGFAPLAKAFSSELI